MSEISRTGWANIGGINYFLEDYQQFTNKSMYLAGGNDFFLRLKNERDFLSAYNSCPPLKAIIGKRAKAFNTGIRKLRNSNTGKELRGFHWLKKLVKKPNVLQNEKQYFAQQNHYIDIFGYCPVLKIRAIGFEDEVAQVWNIPPWLFDLEYTGKLWKQFKIDGIYKNYKIAWEGEEVEVNMRDIEFIFDDGIGTECDTNFTIPDSRLVGLDYVVSNIIAGYKSRHTLLSKRGAIGILSNDAKDSGVAVPLDPDEKDDLQKDFKKYGLTGQPYHVIVTNANLKWQQMGFATKDLMLFEENTENIERLSDAYSWPIELISRGKDVTYDNKIQARKDLYQNTIIPEGESRMEQFSKIIGVDSIEVYCDYSEVPVLQTDKKTMAETRKAINEYCQVEYDADLMTKNDWREELGLPRIEGKPEFDKYKSELQVEEEPIKENENEDDPASKDKGTPAEE